LYDKKVELINTSSKYKKTLRVVRYWHQKDDRIYEYITNNFELSATQIAFIYKSRREIETFFRWIKQNLKIKTFL
jgi:IS4 transposase